MKYQDLSCSSTNHDEPGTRTGSSCWESGQPLASEQPFILNISEATNYNQCGANGDEYCEFSDFTVLDGGKTCDLAFNPKVFSFDGTDTGVVSITDSTINVGLEMYTQLTSGVKVTYSYQNDTARNPIIGLYEGQEYFVYKRVGNTQILLMESAALALALYPNTNSEKSAAVTFNVPPAGLIPNEDGSPSIGTQLDLGYTMSLTYKHQITYETAVATTTLSNTDFDDGGPIDATDHRMNITTEMYYRAVDGSPVAYAKGSGTGIADDGTYYVVKGDAPTATSNGQISIFETQAKAYGAVATRGAAFVSAKIPSTASGIIQLTAAGDATDHTLTLTTVSPVAIYADGGTGCRSVPTIRFVVDERDSESSPVILGTAGKYTLKARLPLFSGLTTSNVVARSANTDVAHGHTYQLWDAGKIQACKCDVGWHGPGCESRIAPKGDDPLTSVKSSLMQQVVQIGHIAPFVTSGGGNRPEQFSMTYYDPYGGVWRTDGIDATTNDAVAASRVEAALRSLPNKVLEGVRVTPRHSDRIPLCTRFYDGVQHISAYTNTRPGAFKDTKGRSNYCETTYYMPTDVNKMDFTVKFADVPGQTGVQYLLDVDIVPRGPGHYPSSRGITGYGAMWSVAEINYNANLGNLSELSECSDRGLDDGEGQCECFDGFRGMACEQQEAIV
jgi:hypothetical protein